MMCKASGFKEVFPQRVNWTEEEKWEAGRILEPCDGFKYIFIVLFFFSP